MRIGILGGTFDPIHNGHLSMARAARDELCLDKVLIIPAGRPYFKGNITPYDTRCEMIHAALTSDSTLTEGASRTDNSGLELSLIESDQDNPTYTYQTLNRLKHVYPDSELFFICGTDVFTSISKWVKPAEVLKAATLAVFDRADSEDGSADRSSSETEDVFIRNRKLLTEIFPGAECVIMKSRIPAVSSTQIRTLVLDGRPIDELVPVSVADYIDSHSVYTYEKI